MKVHYGQKYNTGTMVLAGLWVTGMSVLTNIHLKRWYARFWLIQWVLVWEQSSSAS